MANSNASISSGDRFDRLIVLEEASRHRGKRYWNCRCDCGTECIVQESHLKSGHTKSCGCLARSRIQERVLDLRGQRFGRLTVVELATERKHNAVTWHCICDCGNEIDCEVEFLRRGKTRSCGCLQEEQRKKNMQKAIHFVDGTCIERIACQKEISTNTSGHRGVSQRTNKKWRASIQFRGKRYNLGTHDTFEEAVEARLKGEKMISEYLEKYYQNN